MISLVVADDHRLFREGLIALIDGRAGIEVVAQAGRADDALDRISEWQPNVALLDLEMPGGSVMRTVHVARKVSPETHVVTLSMHDDLRLRDLMFQAGVSACLSKAMRSDDVVREITKLAAMPAPTTSSWPIVGDLTRREVEVLRLVAVGLSNTDIAGSLYLSEGTVKRHLSHIFDKLDVKSRTAAVRAARALGMVA